MALTPNSTFGPFHIVKLICVGGMARVYRARERKGGRVVAVKALRQDALHDRHGELVARFQREVKVVANLRPRREQLHRADDSGEYSNKAGGDDAND